VVGVSVDCTLCLAWLVFWPRYPDRSGEWFMGWLAVLLTAAVMAGLMRFNVGVITVILACGILGMASSLVPLFIP